MGTKWKGVDGSEDVFEGRDRKTDAAKWTGTRADLDLRLALATARARGSLWRERREGEVREGLRRRVGQGDERSTASTSPDLLLERFVPQTRPQGGVSRHLKRRPDAQGLIACSFPPVPILVRRLPCGCPIPNAQAFPCRSLQ